MTARRSAPSLDRAVDASGREPSRARHSSALIMTAGAAPSVHRRLRSGPAPVDDTQRLQRIRRATAPSTRNGSASGRDVDLEPAEAGQRVERMLLRAQVLDEIA